MPSPFAAKTHRDENDDLSGLEADSADEIADALGQQLRQLRENAGSLGGNAVAGIVTAMVRVVEKNSDPLRLAIRTHLTGSAWLGIDAAEAEMPYDLGTGFSWDLAAAEASAFVEQYGFDLVTGINATTEKGLRNALLRWIEDGGALEDLADSIRPLFADEPATARIEALFNVDRATMIAETEATRAYAEGKIRAYTANGLADQPPTKKPPDDSHVRCRCDVALREYDDGWYWVWFTVRDELVCPICMPLHEQQVGLAKAKEQVTG